MIGGVSFGFWDIVVYTLQAGLIFVVSTLLFDVVHWLLHRGPQTDHATLDYLRAAAAAGIKLVGSRTYGKATVQAVFRLRDGSGLRLTVSRYLTPLGRDIEAGLAQRIHVDQISRRS